MCHEQLFGTRAGRLRCKESSICGCRASEALEKLLRKVVERDAEDHESERLLVLNKRAITANRARAHGGNKKATGVAPKQGAHDPYSRKPTKVVQYWSTGKKDEAGQAVAGQTAEDKGAQVRAALFLCHLRLRQWTASCCELSARECGVGGDSARYSLTQHARLVKHLQTCASHRLKCYKFWPIPHRCHGFVAFCAVTIFMQRAVIAHMHMLS
jgi:hypothetical protein